MKKDLREWRPGLVPIIVELALAAVFFTVRLLRTQARLPVLLSLCDGFCIAGLPEATPCPATAPGYSA